MHLHLWMLWFLPHLFYQLVLLTQNLISEKIVRPGNQHSCKTFTTNLTVSKFVSTLALKEASSNMLLVLIP